MASKAQVHGTYTVHDLFAFAAIRQHAWEWRVKADHKQFPTFKTYCDNYKLPYDHIVAHYKFTAPQRIHDRVSAYLINNIAIPQAKFHDENALASIYIFRMFNRISTWEAMPEEYRTHPAGHLKEITIWAEKMQREGEKLYSGAYVMYSNTAHTHSSRTAFYIDQLRKLLQDYYGGFRVLVYNSYSLREKTEYLMSLKGFSTFLAQQFALDYCYMDGADANNAVYPGPGSKKGFKHIFGSFDVDHFEDVMWDWYANQEFYMSDFPYRLYDDGYGFDSRVYLLKADFQNLLCEFDKYCRVKENPKLHRPYRVTQSSAIVPEVPACYKRLTGILINEAANEKV